ncbi:MAG: PH domain-containing protein [Candidatus Pacearchaeota archaeon]
MEKLHPGAKWIFRIGAYFTLIFLGIFLGIWVFPVFLVLSELMLEANEGSNNFYSFLTYIFVYLIFLFVIGEIYARMAYNRWFYEFTKTGLKLERGIIWKKYSNIPYERIQNIDITRGILARILGFSTLNIQTAGYSGPSSRGSFGGHGMSEGHIPAVSKEAAEKIREFVMHRISGKKSGI